MSTFREDIHLGHKVPLVETDDIKDGAITTDKLADESVTTDKLADDSVTSEKIKDGEVKTPDIADGAVTTPKIADDAVTKDKMADGAIGWDELDHNVQNIIETSGGGGGGAGLSTEWGDSEALGITQKTLTEFKEDVEGTLEDVNDTLEDHTALIEAAEDAIDAEEDRAKGVENNLQGQIASNDADIANLQALYEALTQADVVVGALPAEGVENTIYRVPGTGEWYDYLWNGTQFVLMATYDNGIDDVPTAGSVNLVKSGGVWLQGRFIPNESYQGYIGIESEIGVWKDVGSGTRTYKVIPFPYDSGTIRVVANSVGAANVQCLSAHTPVTDSSDGILSAFESISTGNQRVFTIPSGTKYLYVFWTSSSEDRAPIHIYFDGDYTQEYGAFDLMAGIKDAVTTLKLKYDETDAKFNSFISKDYIHYSNTIPNIDSTSNTLDLGSNALLHLLSKNTVVNLPAIFGADGAYRNISLVNDISPLSVIMFNTATNTFSATAINASHTLDEICLGFWNQTSKVGYFNFNFTVDNLPQNVDVFDVSVCNSAQYTSLADAIAAIPSNKRKGGMEIKFILKTNVGTEESPSYTYKYVHYLYANMTTNGFTTTSNWIGLTDEIERNSPQIATSGGVFDYVSTVKSCIIPLMAGDIVEDLAFYNGNAANGQIYYDTPTRLVSNFVRVGDGITFAITNSSSNPALKVNVVGWNNGSTTVIRNWVRTDADVAADSTYDYVTIGIGAVGDAALTPSDINGIGIRIRNNDNGETDYVPKLANLRKKYLYLRASNDPEVLTFIHYSDMHEDEGNFARVKGFYDKYSSYINGGVLDTGDSVNQFSNDLPSVFEDIKGFMRVIGNHDTMNRIGESAPYTWELVDKLQCYNKMLAPYISEWGVTQPDDAATYGYCYWYKDYADNHVRLIALDCEHWDWESQDADKIAEAEAQRTWLVATLEGARQLGYHVVVATHRPPAEIIPQYATNPFDNVDIHNESFTSLQPAMQAVQDFIDNDGVFVCWLCGHAHDDNFGLAAASAYSTQLIVTIACGSVPAAYPYSTMERMDGNDLQDCFNVVGIDVTSKTLKIMRVGANYDRYMRRKNTLSWNYGSGTMIYVD